MHSLQNQLNHLKERQKTAPLLPYGSQCSLLFDFRFSNKIELDTIYEIGYDGLIELSKQDEIFVKYLKLLFSSTSKYFNRDMIPKDELQQYDNHLKQLLYDLSKYFNMKAVHQVLEYLIKVYKVNMYLCDEMILSFLCYYNQAIFIKLLQNINFNEHINWNFLELYAKNGAMISNDVMFSYTNSDFNFLSRLVSFYIDNITIGNEDYYCLILNIIKSKVSSMNNVKTMELNLFQLIMKLINKIHNSYDDIKLKKKEKYTLAYTEMMILLINKVNYAKEYLQAIGNDCIVKVMSHSESSNEIIGMINLLSVISYKYHLLNGEYLYKIEALNICMEKNGLIAKVYEQIHNDNYISDLLYELIVSSNDNLSFVKGIIMTLFKDQSIIEKIIILLVKGNHTKHWSLLEDINVIMFNKAFIYLYKEGLITNPIQTKQTNYGLYFDLISASCAEVLKGIKQCDEDKSIKVISEQIISAIKSKFAFFDEEIILNAVLNMKRVTIDDIGDAILQFYYNINNDKRTNYSDALMMNIQNKLDKKYIGNDIKYELYRDVFSNDTIKKMKSSIKVVIETLSEIVNYSNEVNSKLNIKKTISIIEEVISISSHALNFDECSLIESFINEKNLMKYYPQLLITTIHAYITSMNKSKLQYEDKIPCISRIIYFILNQQSDTFEVIEEINWILNEVYNSKSFSAQQQLLLCYLLFNTSIQRQIDQLIQFIFFKVKEDKQIECLLIFALMMNLSNMSNDKLSFFFNPKTKLKINFTPIDQISIQTQKNKGTPNKNSSSYLTSYTKSLNDLLAVIYSDKNEISINQNYIHRLFQSNSIDYESIYLPLCHLLLSQYTTLYHNISINLLSLFTNQSTFTKEHQSTFLTFIQSINNDSQLECLLLKNFLIFYPHSQFEVILFLQDKTIPYELLDVLFENGFPFNEIKTSEILFQVISFALKNNVSPYTLNISFTNDNLLQYLNYIIKSKVEDNKVIYFFKMVMLMNDISNVELIKKTIEIIKANKTGDININLCYGIYSFSKQLIKAKMASNDSVNIVKSIGELFKLLCDTIDINNAINYEQEKKIQLLLNASNHISAIDSKDNMILIDIAQYINQSDRIGTILKEELTSIILESIITFISLIKQQKDNEPIFYFKYIKCIIDYSIMNSTLLKQLAMNDIMHLYQCEAYFSYHLYDKFSETERNEALMKYILNDKNQRTMFKWMKMIEEIIKLTDTKKRTVNDLTGYIASYILKIKQWDNNEGLIEKDTCTVILNIITLSYTISNELIEKLLQFSRKNNLLSKLLMAIYEPSISMSISYSKSKNFILSKLTPIIPIEPVMGNNNDMISFIIQTVILGNKEKKIENLIFLYQLLTIISTKKIPNNLLKTTLKDILQKIVFSKRNLGHSVYNLTLCKWILTILNLFTMNFLSLLNTFIPSLITVFNESNAFISVKDIKSLVISNMELLTHDICPYLSPFLNNLIGVLIYFDNIEEAKSVLIKIGAKNIFDSSFECVKINQTQLNSLLLIFLNSSITAADGVIIADLGNDIMTYFIQILLNYQPLLKEIKECIQSFILKLHGKQLKIIFNELIKVLTTKDETNEYQLNNSIVIFQIFNTILSIIKDLFIKNYFIKYKDLTIQLLNISNAFIFHKTIIPLKLGQKTKRDIVNDKTNDLNGFSYYKLSCLLLDNIKMNFKYSKGELLSETTEEFFEPVLNQLKLSNDQEVMMKYYDEAVKDCLYEMFKNCKNDELLGKFNEDLLELLREENHVTRILTLRTVLHLLEKLKERYIGFIEDIIQCVSDRLEDSNDLVHKTARETIKCIEKITGESYKTYLE